MERRKLTKEDIDKVRSIEGFPIGTDKDIIALSDAPYYTACPNPFIEEFIRENGTPYDEATDDYHREPFASDVSEGKSDPIYVAHSYHTKVPHKAIMKYLLHYTDPGDIILDGFCGSGMAGVAAQMCGVDDYALKADLMSGMPKAEWGARKAILSDLAPIASFLSYNYNSEFDYDDFLRTANELIKECEKKYSWMFKTKHVPSEGTERTLFDISGEGYGEINHVVWSDVFVCPKCGKEITLWDVGMDFEHKRANDDLSCPNCALRFKKKDASRSKFTYYDDIINETVTVSKQVPVMIVYTYMGKRYSKKPDAEDFALLEKIQATPFEYYVPKAELPDGLNTEQPKQSHGFNYVHQFYTRRNLLVVSYLSRAIYEGHLAFEYTALLARATKQLRLLVSNFFNGGGGWVGTGLSGTLFIPSYSMEVNILLTFANRIERALTMNHSRRGQCICSCQSTTDLRNVPDSSIDYIFTDPPFGSNINYSELSFIWESWLRVRTNNEPEAIINSTQGKALPDYQRLMERCFSEYYRVLKPNRWMTVEFHNSQNAVWNSIQEALIKVGFVIADVRTLDKKQASFKQVTTTSAVKQDLVISVYKPKDSFIRDFSLKAGTEETAWAFVRQHLSNIPVVVVKNEKIELISERQAFLLFDRMVAYHIMQGIPVPLDATDFYKGLDEKFLKRDGMYFLADQVNEYDTARIKNDVEPIQFSFFVTNEKTAISWLYQQLDEPQTYAEIQPKFMQEVKSVDRYEEMPELAVLLEENFLQDEKGRWYIPDVTKEGDVAKLREKKLWKEFEGYLNSKGKLKLFRSEAIRVGFSRLWKDKNYQAIVDIANRLPEQTIQEDPNLLMYYDISLSRV